MHINGVAAGEGKGWSKGRKAKDDPRIERNAAAHRGRTYISHVAPMDDRRRRSAPASTEWTPRLAYAVGLLATDGCQTDGRHLAFPSADRELVEILLECLGKRNKIAKIRTRTGGFVYRTQIGDVAFCKWLQTIGITPRKSLTLGPIAVPDDLLFECARGLLDGDGSILNFVHAPTKRTYPGYRYERLVVQFVSASRPHLEWLRDRVERELGDRGSLSGHLPKNRTNTMWRLAYGKAASTRLLALLYRDERLPRLRRKWGIWEGYRSRNCADGGT